MHFLIQREYPITMRKILYLLALTALAGCDALYPSYMLKTSKDYHFDRLIDSTTAANYKISPNDFLNMRLFSQNGFHIIDLTNTSNTGSAAGGGGSTGSTAASVTTSIDYLV